MTPDRTVQIAREDLYRPEVDAALEHQRALLRQSRPDPVAPVSPLRRTLLSSHFYLPLAGLLGGLTAWLLIEPIFDDSDVSGASILVDVLLFSLTATLVVLFIFVVEMIASRRWRNYWDRCLIAVSLTFLFSLLARVPMGFVLMAILLQPDRPTDFSQTAATISPSFLFGFIVIRSCAWAILGAALGVGMNIVRSSRAQLRASVMGGTVGGALGGLFFDPIDRFLQGGVQEASLSRCVGLCMVGLCVGIFISISERLGREAWLRVRTGPLAGKSFIIYHNPTIIGSSPKSDIYLFKDAAVSPSHAAINRVGGSYEIEDLNSQHGTIVEGRAVRRYRLNSGDQIELGATALEFEERAKRRKLDDTAIQPANHAAK